MRLKVRIETLRELVKVSGVPVGDLADAMSLSQTMTSFKLAGSRPLFLDEIPAIVSAINNGERVEVTDEQVMDLVGKRNLKVRGYAG